MTHSSETPGENRSYQQIVQDAFEAGLIFDELYQKMVVEQMDGGVQERAQAILLKMEEAPYARKKLRLQLERLVGFNDAYRPASSDLERMDLVDLYHVKKSLFDGDFRGLSGKMRVISDSIRLKGQVVKTVTGIGRQIRKTANIQEATDVHALGARQSVEEFRDDKGLTIEVDYNDCTLEELNAAPHAYYFNHQGGGLETLLVASLFNDGRTSGRPNSILAKTELEKIPMMSDILRRLGAIFVNRKNLKDEAGRRAEITRVAAQMKASIEDGRGLIVYPEGTRSNDGNIAGSPQRLKWGKDIHDAVLEATQQKPVSEVLVVVDTLLAFPSTVEAPKNWLDDTVRKNAGVRLKFYKLPEGIPFEDNAANQFDQSNFFGFARAKLADMQREELKKLLK